MWYSKVASWFRSVDMFGNSFTLNRKGNSTYQTLPGAFVSLVVIGLLLWYVVLLVQNILNTTNPNVSLVTQISFDPSNSVTVQGTITNKAGGSPISGGLFIVLNPGITLQQFVNDNTPDSDIFTFGKSDSSGAFTLPDALTRNQKYSVLVGAKGFKTISTDNFLIKDTDPDPLVLDIQLSK